MAMSDQQIVIALPLSGYPIAIASKTWRSHDQQNLYGENGWLNHVLLL